MKRILTRALLPSATIQSSVKTRWSRASSPKPSKESLKSGTRQFRSNTWLLSASNCILNADTPGAKASSRRAAICEITSASILAKGLLPVQCAKRPSHRVETLGVTSKTCTKSLATPKTDTFSKLLPLSQCQKGASKSLDVIKNPYYNYRLFLIRVITSTPL